MKSNIYVIRDKVADDIVLLAMSKTDGLFVRQNVPYLSKLNPNFMDDMEILCIGEFTDSSMSISPSPARLVSWDSYKTPEQKGDKFSVNAEVKK